MRMRKTGWREGSNKALQEEGTVLTLVKTQTRGRKKITSRVATSLFFVMTEKLNVKLGTSGWTVYAQRNSVSTAATQASAVKLKTTRFRGCDTNLSTTTVGLSLPERQSSTFSVTTTKPKDELWNNEPRAHSVQAADLVEFILNRRDV
jgi:hypothetical protein